MDSRPCRKFLYVVRKLLDLPFHVPKNTFHVLKGQKF